MEDKQKLDLLKKVDFIATLSQADIKKLIKSNREVRLVQNQVLFEDEDAGISMFVILSGGMAIYKGNKIIAIRGQGEYFGEMALIESKPRAASAKAVMETELLEISEEQFHNNFTSNAKALLTLLKTLSRRTRDDLDILRQDFEKLESLERKSQDLKRAYEDLEREIAAKRLIATEKDGATYSNMSLNMQKVGLTRREMEVACLICSGISDKEIAERLYISNYTAKDHVKNIFKKVKVHNRSKLILELLK